MALPPNDMARHSMLTVGVNFYHKRTPANHQSRLFGVSCPASPALEPNTLRKLSIIG